MHGKASLARDLDQMISSRQTRSSEFLKSLARNTAGQVSGRSIFGGLKTENGRFNVKANVLLPMVETIRVLAISRGITARTSAARAKVLVQLDDIPNEVQHYRMIFIWHLVWCYASKARICPRDCRPQALLPCI